MASRKTKNPFAQANKARAAAAKVRRSIVQRGLSALKKFGLFGGDVRKAAKVSRGSSLVKRFAGVIRGTDAAVKVDRRTKEGKAAIEAYKASGGLVRNDRVIVAKASPGEQVRFNKRSGFVEGKRYAFGTQVLRRIAFQRVFDPDKLPKVKSKNTVYYSTRFNKGATQRFERREDLIAWMSRYPQALSPKAEVREKWAQFWASHVVIEEVVGKVRPGRVYDVDGEEDDD